MEERPLLEMVRFSRDGRRLVLRDGATLAVLEVPGGEEHALPGDGEGGGFVELRGFAAFEDEIWVVAGEAAPRLLRFSMEGAPIGEPVALPGGAGEGRLLPAPAGDPSAIWTGDAPCEIRLEGKAIVVDPIAAEERFAVPIAPRRRLEVRDGVLHRIEPDGEVPLAAAGPMTGAHLIEGAAILDGRAAAMLIERGGTQTLLVVALQSGLVQNRVAFSEARAARFASGRGHAMVRVGEQRLVVVDLRFGRTLKQWEEPTPLIDFAIDAAARGLVLQRRTAEGAAETFFGSYRDILGAPPVQVRDSRSAAAVDEERAESESIADSASEDEESTEPEPSDAAGDGGETDESDSTPKSEVASGANRGAIGSIGSRPSLGARRPPPPRLPTALPGSAATEADEAGDGAGAPRALRPPPVRSPLQSRGPRPPVPPPRVIAPPVRRSSDAQPGSTILDLPDAPRALSTEPAPARPLPPRPIPAPRNEPRSFAPARGEPRPFPPIHHEPRPSSSGRSELRSFAPARHEPRPPIFARGESRPSPPAPDEPDAPALTEHDPPTESRPTPTAHSSSERRTPLDSALDLVTVWCARALASAHDEGRADALHAPPMARDLLAPTRGLATQERSEAELAAAREEAAFNEARGGPPFSALTQQFSLSPRALDLLLIAAAPWLRTELSSLFGHLGHASGAASLTLAARLLETTPAALLVELDAEAPLVRHRLLRAPHGPASTLAIDPLAVRRLLGEALDAPGRHGALHVPDDTRPLDELSLPDGLVDALMPRFARGPRLLLRGRRGSGRKSLVAALASAHGERVGFVDLTAAGALDDPSRALHEAALRGLLPCAVRLDEVAPAAIALVLTTLSAHPGPLVIVSGAATPSIAGFDVFDLAPLSPAARTQSIAETLARHGLPSEDAGALAGRWTVSPGAFNAVASAAAEREWPQSDHSDLARALAAAQRRIGAARLTPGCSPRATQPSPVRFDPLIEDAMVELEARCALARRSGDRVIAVLAGRAGSGRRLFVDELTARLRLDVHRVGGAELADDRGGASSALARLLDECEAGGPLLHVTEADHLLAAPLPPLLRARLAGSTGVTLFSLDSAAPIDPTTLPLVTTRIAFPPPDATTREALWRAYLPDDLAAHATTLAEHELNGGQIRAAITRARLLAGDSPLDALHMERAVRLVAG